MRIISGFLKGRRIKELKGFHSRPTTDFAKEGLFNVLEHSIEIDGALILDLFAGTGNISYEFISRGAKTVFSVDSNYCLLYTSPSPRDATLSRMPSSA